MCIYYSMKYNVYLQEILGNGEEGTELKAIGKIELIPSTLCSFFFFFSVVIHRIQVNTEYQ